MDWRDDYKKKLVSADEAAKSIKSGDVIAIPVDSYVKAMSQAIIRRRNELENVKILLRSADSALGWTSEDLKPSFIVISDTTYHAPSSTLSNKEIDFIPALSSLRFKGDGDPRRDYLRKLDVALVVVSPPDNNGYCSYGPYLSNKKDYTMSAKRVIAEVSDISYMMVKTFGDNFIHVSEIDYFVPHIPPQPAVRKPENMGKDEQAIADYVTSLIRDGDTIHVGFGLITSSIPLLGDFHSKHDLGLHSTIMVHGIVNLIKDGVINGKRKNINRGKAVSVGMSPTYPEDLKFFDGNPMFETRMMSYVDRLQVIAANDNMVAINSILAIDLDGQIALDSIGRQSFMGSGGGADFLMGSMLSRGGASISVLRSTAGRGTISRIVPTLEQGTIVTVPRSFADFVVTEYGIAKLFGKTNKERAQELIAIAHPNFRADLKKQAEKLFG
jgi:4-hydroxybutyrate CoA-transferase